MRLHRTDRRKLVTIFIIQLYRQKYCTPFYLFRVLDECTEGIVLQQSNLVDSTVTKLLLETRDGIHCKWSKRQKERRKCLLGF